MNRDQITEIEGRVVEACEDYLNSIAATTPEELAESIEKLKAAVDEGLAEVTSPSNDPQAKAGRVK